MLPTLRVARLTALLCAAFLVAGGARMLWNHTQYSAEVFLQPADLLAAKEELRRSPGDEKLKERIRAMDLALRRRYFRHLETNAYGAWLLMVAGVIFVVACQRAVSVRRALPVPAVQADGAAELPRARARWAVSAVAAAVGGALLGYAATSRGRVPASHEALQALLAGGEQEVSEAGPSPEAVRTNWPWFRGPTGDGVAATTNAPRMWNSSTGEGILWKVPVPQPGFNSPIVWGDRVFLTGGTAASRHVLCYDTSQGSLLWDKAVPVTPGSLPRSLEAPEHTGFAASTAATDGRRVYAVFGTGELAAYDFGGRLVWSRLLGVPENMYGHATSLLCHGGLLLVQFDQGEAEAGKSRLVAFEGRTGEIRWESRRQVPSSWTTPLAIEMAGRVQLITMAEPWVISYDPATGAEVWRLECLGTDLAPSPILAGDLLVAVSPGKHVAGIRVDGQGDVSKTHIAWQFDALTPDITSPVSDGELVYFVTTSGTLVCLEGASGQRVWERELEVEFNASPVRVGRELYLMDTKGTTLVVETGREFREVGRATLEDEVHASPAIVSGRVYVRGRETLYALGARGEGGGQP